MILRGAGLADAPSIARVHVDTWRTNYRGIVPEDTLTQLSYEERERGWSQILSSSVDSGQFTYVAEDELGQIVGFVRGGPERTSDLVYQGELQASTS